MLRGWTISLGVLMLVAGALLWQTGSRFGSIIPLLVWGILIAGGVLIERYRYKPVLDAPLGAGWVDTGERETGAQGAVAVWHRPKTGERAYVRCANS